MNFGFTEEQELLRAEVRKFLDQNCPLEEVRKHRRDARGLRAPLWDRMAELGWVGLTLPEAYGGVGLGWVDLVVVLEETGRTLFPSPLIASVLAANAIARAGDAAQQKRWLPRIGRRLERRDARAARGERLGRTRPASRSRESATATASC